MGSNWLNNFMQRKQKADETFGSDDEEQEDKHSYCKNGYHPVSIGDVYHNRYLVTRKLGWGNFSTVWLCRDRRDKRLVALKIVKSATEDTKSAINEIELLKCVRQRDTSGLHKNQIVQLLDNFQITGVNGIHVCMVFEVLGHNLFTSIAKSGNYGLPLTEVKNITRQVLAGLDYLHTTCKIVHTDIKPENICLNGMEVTIADLGNACWVDDCFAEVIQTRSYRSPEVILGAGYGPEADIWSTACMAFELATGDYLFPVEQSGKIYSKDETHLGEIVSLLGEIPEAVVLSSKHFDMFFTAKGKLCHCPKFKRCGIFELLTEVHDWGFDEAHEFEDFLMPMLTIDPDNRYSAKECLRHYWLGGVRTQDSSVAVWPISKVIMVLMVFYCFVLLVRY